MKDNYADDVKKFEKATLFTVKCYEVNIRICGRKEASHILKAVIIDTKADLELINKDALPTDSIRDIQKFLAFQKSTDDSSFNATALYDYFGPERTLRLWHIHGGAHADSYGIFHQTV